MNNASARIRNGDTVEVIAGNHKKAQGKVIRVNVEKQRVVVENVRFIYKHARRSQQFPNGGIIRREGDIHVSNVRLIRRSDERDRSS